MNINPPAYYYPWIPIRQTLSSPWQLQSTSFQPGLEFQYEKLKKQNEVLKSKLVKSQEQKKQGQREINHLRELLQRKDIKRKRKYRKRKNSIERKIFRCSFEDCSKRYSSKIALNAHTRKKHTNIDQDLPLA